MTIHLSFIERYRQLIQIPTISSLNEKYDISNKALIELLAYWFSDLGFKTEIIAINGS
ncbi:acetylornithine deacetylase domain protein, partial [Glaesserella parasuis 12939]